MFYSQFILAKKGPLGTIWIAAHLERKLRKNQVADTDIGVSVDSILSPDVPIALRLSSHLLLGVVRIYSRKVNYLFDDCSEALLKVKQAFRSTVVDLPPEESKAPYHSITLPETFDLDDFELPDTEVFQGNFVDHHVSTKEQITLQDTMEGVIYSTSQFGLDERFGDGDASQIALDLDEELLLNKSTPSGHGVLLTSRVDPQTSVEPSSPSQKGDELDVEMHDHYEAVATDCCMEGDELDVEMHDPSQAVATDCCMEDIEKSGSQVGSPSTDQPMEQIVPSNIVDISGTEVFESSKDLNPEFDLNGSLGECELNGGLDVNNSGECGEAKENGVNESMLSVDDSDKLPPLSEQADLHHHDKSPVNGFYSVSENPSSVDQTSVDPAKNAEDKLDVNSNAVNIEGNDLISPETSEVANVVSKADLLSVCKPILQPCNFPNNQEVAEIDNVVSMPKDFGVGSEDMSGMHDASDVSVARVQDFTNQSLNEDQFRDADHRNNLDGQPSISENMQFEKGNDSIAPALPSPERMLSLPDVPISQPTALLVGSTPEHGVLAQGDQDATMSKITGKKRSLTESTITLQSQNSVESSEAAQSKQPVDFVPDDEDLLSSILVGRRSTVLKVKSTSPAFGLVSSKRRRATPRSGAQKRKVLVDDSMVLHGDTIRQQLVSTEDIRRVRKKAPSTPPEIWIIQKQFWPDEMFNEPIFTGVSSKLISLHCHPFDISETKLVQDDGSKAQSTTNDTVLSPQRPAVGGETELEGTSVPTVARDDSGLQCAECPNDAPIEQSIRVSNDLFCTLEKESMTNSEVGCTPSQFELSENRTEMETQLDISENRTEMETQFDISENRTEMEETDCRREPAADEKDHSVAFGIESSSCLPCASENNADLINGDMIRSSCFKDTNDPDYSEQIDGSCPKLDEGSSGKDGLLTVDNNVEGIGFGEGVDKADFGDVVEHRPEEGDLEVRLENADSVVPIADAEPQYTLPVNGENIIAEDRTSDEGRTHEPGTVNKDDELHESDLKYDEQREDSKVDPSDPVEDIFDHDTDFLNFDDDEIVEDIENDNPNAEGAQILDNSGWSTRTRAVANYLQVLFHKEAQHGRTVLHLDNLLAKKTRKEASRMFFETLVLKTRDYIHVDEEVPFGNISIKPRARLLKSEF